MGRVPILSPVFEEDHAFRYFMKTVMESLPTIYLQFSKEFPPVAAEDLGIVSASLQENFIRALFFEYHVGRQWGIMWKEYYSDMASDKRTYVLMVLYSCLEIYHGKESFYERFLDIFGMVAGASHAFSINMDYHVYAAPILMVFFVICMQDDFYHAGGWSGLDKYLQGLYYLDWYFVRGDLKYRDVRKQFNQQVAWKRSAKSYRGEIRFISTYDACDDEMCNAMVDKVLTLDTTVCDRPDEGTAGSILAKTNISRVRRSLKRWKKPLSLNLETSEIIEREGESEIRDKLAKLRKQGDFEDTMLKAAVALMQGIRDRLKEAEAVSDTLKQLYSCAVKQ